MSLKKNTSSITKDNLKSNPILIDTREQKPIRFDCSLFIKLDVGDYTNGKHHNKLHLERKSAGDLYGTLLGGHTRFRKEVKRAQAKNIKLIMIIECTKKVFLARTWSGAHYGKVSSITLARIIKTMEIRYQLEFVWCNGRTAMKKTILKLLK